jgi:hypothetical protein
LVLFLEHLLAEYHARSSVGADKTATGQNPRTELLSPAVTHRVHLVLVGVVIGAISLVATQSATTAPLAPASPSPVGAFERALANEFNAFSKQRGLRAAAIAVSVYERLEAARRAA